MAPGLANHHAGDRVMAAPEQIAATILDMVKNRIPAKFGLDAISDIQVLCPMNRRSLGIAEPCPLLIAHAHPVLKTTRQPLTTGLTFTSVVNAIELLETSKRWFRAYFFLRSTPLPVG
jgi:hypothetical protein